MRIYRVTRVNLTPFLYWETLKACDKNNLNNECIGCTTELFSFINIAKEKTTRK